jgi:hypothetical protein
MVGQYFGRITAFEVRENSPRGLATFVTTFRSPPTAPVVTVFKLDEDSDQSFAGMAAICANQVNALGTNVKIEVQSGADDEIDTITAL